jgi:hypothetical protein
VPRYSKAQFTGRKRGPDPPSLDVLMTTAAEEIDLTHARYHAYLIRLWRDSARASWRASLTHAGTGDVLRFATPELAWAYLQRRLAGAPVAGPTPGTE